MHTPRCSHISMFVCAFPLCPQMRAWTSKWVLLLAPTVRHFGFPQTLSSPTSLQQNHPRCWLTLPCHPQLHTDRSVGSASFSVASSMHSLSSRLYLIQNTIQACFSAYLYLSVSVIMRGRGACLPFVQLQLISRTYFSQAYLK